jgi:hypothetical protein
VCAARPLLTWHPASCAHKPTVCDWAHPGNSLRIECISCQQLQCLIPAAGNNEIDQPLLDLLQQNIAAAKAASQEKPAEFMQKVQPQAYRFACWHSAATANPER